MGLNKLNHPEHRWKFQGQEEQKEFGLNWSSFKYRNADVAIGRFHSVDPLAEDYVYNSTYAFSENNVTGDFELEGLEKKNGRDGKKSSAKVTAQVVAPPPMIAPPVMLPPVAPGTGAKSTRRPKHVSPFDPYGGMNPFGFKETFDKPQEFIPQKAGGRIFGGNDIFSSIVKRKVRHPSEYSADEVREAAERIDKGFGNTTDYEVVEYHHYASQAEEVSKKVWTLKQVVDFMHIEDSDSQHVLGLKKKYENALAAHRNSKGLGKQKRRALYKAKEKAFKAYETARDNERRANNYVYEKYMRAQEKYRGLRERMHRISEKHSKRYKKK